MKGKTDDIISARTAEITIDASGHKIWVDVDGQNW